MYQRPSGEIVLFIGTDVYMFSVETLQLLDGYPIPITYLGVREPYKVNGVVNTYTWRTYIFYNDDYYGEVDECSFRIKKYGYTKDDFPRLPRGGIDGVFRYTDGKIYFFKDKYTYVYDEFEDTMERRSIDRLSIIGIKCLDSTLVENLIDFLRGYLV